jgi:hypothetical protein
MKLTLYVRTKETGRWISVPKSSPGSASEDLNKWAFDLARNHFNNHPDVLEFQRHPRWKIVKENDQ